MFTFLEPIFPLGTWNCQAECHIFLFLRYSDMMQKDIFRL